MQNIVHSVFWLCTLLFCLAPVSAATHQAEHLTQSIVTDAELKEISDLPAAPTLATLDNPELDLATVPGPPVATPCPIVDSPTQQYSYLTSGEKTVARAKLPLVKTDKKPSLLCTHINRLIEQQSIEIAGERIANAEDILIRIYQQRQFAPVWSEQTRRQILFRHLENIEEDGLNRDDYHYSSLYLLQQQLDATPEQQEHQVNLDLLLSNALLRLVYHLNFGKVSPHELDSNWNFKREFSDNDPVALFNEVVASDAQLDSFLLAQRNQGQLYEYLKQSLKQYRNIALSGGWPLVPNGKKLRPGKRDKRLPIIYQRLLITGDIKSPPPETTVYNKAMVEGIKNFQHRHGLAPDGVIGKQTLTALSMPVTDRIDQIRANMERLRWLSQELKNKYVLINVAGFQAYLVEGKKVLWRSKVQVGRFKRQTPIFKDKITYLEFNPTWTVPPTILKEDVFPKLRQGVDILAKKGLTVINNRGQTIDKSAVDWASYNAKNFPYMLRQPPGPRNALGLVKIMFPNRHSVYLHDTPEKNNFKRSIRTFSSGCVRLENPFELAELLLGDSKKWNQSKFERILNSRKTSRVNLPEPTPILLVYATVDFDLEIKPQPDRLISFKPDIYQRDANIIKALKQPFRYNAPKSINAKLKI